MVAMQDRIGLSSGLIDVANSGLNAADKGAMWSAEQWRRAQREWKARRAGAGKNTTTPTGTATAEEGSTREKEKEGGGGTYPYGGQQKGGMRGGMEEDEEGMVGSEVFDDENGLAGVLSPEEREKARREQMAWDEKKKKSQEVERRVSSAAAAAVPVRSTMGTRDDDEGRRRQTMVRWEEKPKVVYA